MTTYVAATDVTTDATATSAAKTNGSSQSHPNGSLRATTSDTVRLVRDISQLKVMKLTATLSVTVREQEVKRDLDRGWL